MSVGRCCSGKLKMLGKFFSCSSSNIICIIIVPQCDNLIKLIFDLQGYIHNLNLSNSQLKHTLQFIPHIGKFCKFTVETDFCK